MISVEKRLEMSEEQQWLLSHVVNQTYSSPNNRHPAGFSPCVRLTGAPPSSACVFTSAAVMSHQSPKFWTLCTCWQRFMLELIGVDDLSNEQPLADARQLGSIQWNSLRLIITAINSISMSTVTNPLCNTQPITCARERHNHLLFNIGASPENPLSPTAASWFMLLLICAVSTHLYVLSRWLGPHHCVYIWWYTVRKDCLLFSFN